MEDTGVFDDIFEDSDAGSVGDFFDDVVISSGGSESTSESSSEATSDEEFDFEGCCFVTADSESDNLFFSDELSGSESDGVNYDNGFEQRHILSHLNTFRESVEEDELNAIAIVLPACLQEPTSPLTDSK